MEMNLTVSCPNKHIVPLTPLSDLKLGDVVRLNTLVYGDATVKCINPDGSVVLFRPFVQIGDFSHTGGVSCYIGVEEFTIYSRPVYRVRNGPKLK